MFKITTGEGVNFPKIIKIRIHIFFILWVPSFLPPSLPSTLLPFLSASLFHGRWRVVDKETWRKKENIEIYIYILLLRSPLLHKSICWPKNLKFINETLFAYKIFKFATLNLKGWVIHNTNYLCSECMSIFLIFIMRGGKQETEAKELPPGPSLQVAEWEFKLILIPKPMTVNFWGDPKGHKESNLIIFFVKMHKLYIQTIIHWI